MAGEGKKPLYRELLLLAFLLSVISAASSLISEQSWRAGGVTLIWPTNGFLIGYLLCAPRRRWPAYLAIGFLVDLGVNLLLGESWASPYLALCNMVEVGLAVVLMYRSISSPPDLTQRKQLTALTLYGMVVAPGVASGLAALTSFLFAHHGSPYLRHQFLLFRTWYLADALGAATVTPLYWSYRFRVGYNSRSWGERIGLFLLVIAATLLIFLQSRVPLLFLLLPILLLLGIRLGLAASALGLLMVSVIGGLLTTWGHGPAMLIQNSTLAFRDLALQIFIAIAMLLLYIAEVVTSESTRLQLSLKASEARFRLLAESSRDIIVMLGLHGERLYVSPAITEVLGWQPQEVLAETFRDRVHPEDAQKLTQLLEDCAAGKPTRPLAYRSRTKGGEYHWLETNPRLYHDPLTGEPAGIVSILRDVAERKTAEEELSRAFRMVQNLASIDGLTGIANRRLFDETLEREWRRAVRDGRQLSLALLDVDHFKLYNDLYGHLSGDDCLRQIAESIRNVVTRAADLAARYGGEEFALILPNTDRNGALKICNEILAAVRKRNIVHNANPHAVVTVSAGCMTCIARDDSNYRVALEAADAALYRAKALGRNRVEVAHSAGGSCGDPPSQQLPPASAVSS
jgi:diguanylate cyclase (GGDEF)-like protein/PAS domain S-box-containing protein